MVTIDDADALDLGALLEGDRAALDLEILDQRHAVAALQHVAAGILDDALAIFVAAFRNCLRPFETAVGADVVRVQPTYV